MTNFLYIIAFFSLAICILYNLSVRYNKYNNILNNNQIMNDNNDKNLKSVINDMNNNCMTKLIDKESNIETKPMRKEDWKKNIKMKLLNSCYDDSNNDELNKSLVSKNLFIHP